MSLRERQKINRRNAILKAARTLFEENSYSQTTMEQIAEQAEVGIATLYNYFGTKEGMLAELTRQDMEWIRDKCQIIVDNPPSNPIQAMQLLFAPYEESRRLATNEMISTYLKGARQNDGPLRETAQWANKWMTAQVKHILESAKLKGSLTDDLSIDEATEIILVLFNQSYVKAFGKDKKLAAIAFRKFTRRIPLLFADWRNADTTS